MDAQEREHIINSYKMLENYTFNLQKNFETLNISEFKTTGENERLSEELARGFAIASGLLPVFIHMICYFFLKAPYVIVGLTAIKSKESIDTETGNKVLSIKNRLKLSRESQATWNTIFFKHFNNVAIIFTAMVIFRIHYTDKILGWILQPELVCAHGVPMPMDQCISKLEDLVDTSSKRFSDIIANNQNLENNGEFWEWELSMLS